LETKNKKWNTYTPCNEYNANHDNKKPTKQNTANCQTSKQIKPCPTCFSKHVVFLCSKVAQKMFLFVVRIGVEKTMPPKMVMKVMKTMTKQKKKNQSKGSKGLE